jgi:hypothetical protein
MKGMWNRKRPLVRFDASSPQGLRYDCTRVLTLFLPRRRVDATYGDATILMRVKSPAGKETLTFGYFADRLTICLRELITRDFFAGDSLKLRHVLYILGIIGTTR